MRIGGVMRHRHMSKREWLDYRQSYRDYAKDLEREHRTYFNR